jgi:ribose transport system ATP-binding protein
MGGVAPPPGSEIRTEWAEEAGEPSQVLLHATGLEKRYGNAHALRGVDFELRRAEVMGLVGQNGAGKSTLVKILVGLERPDAGHVRVGGTTTGYGRRHRGVDVRQIAVVQQEPSVVRSLSVAENVLLGAPSIPVAAGRKAVASRAEPFLSQVGLQNIDPNLDAGKLTVAERQLVEIARVLLCDAQIVMFDEPTAALGDREIERVLAVIRGLRESRRSIVYITHRLDEIFQIADRVTVFRDGRSSPPLSSRDTTRADLVERMLGSAVGEIYPMRSQSAGDEVLKVSELWSDGLTLPVTFSLRQGEILGLAGQLGSGTAAVLESIAGARQRLGTIDVKGRRLPVSNIKAAIAAGVTYCSADRRHDGIFAIRSISENLSSPAIRRLAWKGFINRRKERRQVSQIAQQFQISQARLGSPAAVLSGGNQQKVALGKWMSASPIVLLVNEPTRGVDVGARAEIYRVLRTLANRGLGIIFASSDIDEVIGLADIVATFFRGELVSILPSADRTTKQVLGEISHARPAAE